MSALVVFKKVICIEDMFLHLLAINSKNERNSIFDRQGVKADHSQQQKNIAALPVNLL